MTNPEQRLIVTDLDGTLLHDAPTFEERFITQRSIDTVKRMHDAGYRFAVATARPVSTGFEYAGKLPVDAYIYLNLRTGLRGVPVSARRDTRPQPRRRHG